VAYGDILSEQWRQQEQGHVYESYSGPVARAWILLLLIIINNTAGRRAKKKKGNAVLRILRFAFVSQQLTVESQERKAPLTDVGPNMPFCSRQVPVPP
jgi:hypothetical protein